MAAPEAPLEALASMAPALALDTPSRLVIEASTALNPGCFLFPNIHNAYTPIKKKGKSSQQRKNFGTKERLPQDSGEAGDGTWDVFSAWRRSSMLSWQECTIVVHGYSSEMSIIHVNHALTMLFNIMDIGQLSCVFNILE